MELSKKITIESYTDEFQERRKQINDEIIRISKKEQNICEMYDTISKAYVYEMDVSGFSKHMGCLIFIQFYKKVNYLRLIDTIELETNHLEQIKTASERTQNEFFEELLKLTQTGGINPELMLNDPPRLIFG